MSTPVLQEDYRVTLDAFQGPLDLLLYLIRRLEVDVTAIPVAEVTDQYLAFLNEVDDIDVELAGEFLVMAATLIELKSRTLMPPETADTDAADGDAPRPAVIDPGQELVQQLLAYQRFRLAAEALDERRNAFFQRYPVRPARGGRDDAAAFESEPVELELDDVHVMDLADAYERIMSSIDFDRLGDHVVEVDDTPIALHQADLLDRLERSGIGRLTLQTVFAGHSRVQRVGLFLATLELARLRRIDVQQPTIDAEIEIVLVSGEEPISPTPGG
ncbi:MAG: segregation/condensation protein A [Phycisphaerales bacterium]|nr:segregation/condensation protein A [Phycisphaerae bacterium]NNF44419.1 segregation/condensation protein A [Phycisphaerales bacterium]NNM24655.1 segregation/condensation protein A [Phycisphaerales bacterium]